MQIKVEVSVEALPALPERVIIVGPEDAAKQAMAFLAENFPSVASVWYPDLTELDQAKDQGTLILNLGDFLAQDARRRQGLQVVDIPVDPVDEPLFGKDGAPMFRDILSQWAETPLSGRQNPPRPPKGGPIPERTIARRKRKIEQAAREKARRGA